MIPEKACERKGDSAGRKGLRRTRIGGAKMARRIFSGDGFLDGVTNFYDESGRMIGYSQKGLFGDDEYFDASGRYVGFSSEGLLGDKLYFDRNGRNAGFSTEGLLSDEVHFNADGFYAGFSGEGLFGGTNTFLDEDTDFFDPED